MCVYYFKEDEKRYDILSDLMEKIICLNLKSWKNELLISFFVAVGMGHWSSQDRWALEWQFKFRMELNASWLYGWERRKRWKRWKQGDTRRTPTELREVVPTNEFFRTFFFHRLFLNNKKQKNTKWTKKGSINYTNL